MFILRKQNTRKKGKQLGSETHLEEPLEVVHGCLPVDVDYSVQELVKDVKLSRVRDHCGCYVCSLFVEKKYNIKVRWLVGLGRWEHVYVFRMMVVNNIHCCCACRAVGIGIRQASAANTTHNTQHTATAQKIYK